MVDAQATSPQNGTSNSSSTNQFILDIMSDPDLHVAIEPLTNNAGLTGTQNDLQVGPPGSLKQSFADVK